MRAALASAAAGALGAVPHVLHHAGPLAGAALAGGAGGTALFGALGLAATVPLLVRVRRRTGSWHAPAGLVALFASVFALSAFVVGPALAGDDTPAADRRDGEPTQGGPDDDAAGHDGHHRGR